MASAVHQGREDFQAHVVHEAAGRIGKRDQHRGADRGQVEPEEASDHVGRDGAKSVLTDGGLREAGRAKVGEVFGSQIVAEHVREEKGQVVADGLPAVHPLDAHQHHHGPHAPRPRRPRLDVLRRYPRSPVSVNENSCLLS
jgi:hypothetical protein